MSNLPSFDTLCNRIHDMTMEDPTTHSRAILPEHEALLQEYARDSSPSHYVQRYQTARAKYDAGLSWNQIIDDDPGFKYNDWLCSNYTRSSEEVWNDVTQQDESNAGRTVAEGSAPSPHCSSSMSPLEIQQALQRLLQRPENQRSANLMSSSNGYSTSVDDEMADATTPDSSVPTHTVPGHQGSLSWDVWHTSPQSASPPFIQVTPPSPTQDRRVSTMLTPHGEGLAELSRALPSGTVPDNWNERAARGQRIVRATFHPSDEENARILAEEARRLSHLR